MMLAQNMNLKRSNQEVQQAAQLVQRAQQAAPCAEIPFIKPATVRKGMVRYHPFPNS